MQLFRQRRWRTEPGRCLRLPPREPFPSALLAPPTGTPSCGPVVHFCAEDSCAHIPRLPSLVLIFPQLLSFHSPKPGLRLKLRTPKTEAPRPQRLLLLPFSLFLLMLHNQYVATPASTLRVSPPAFPLN